ncbi:hypothetical protein [uncultured Ruminococcus sp.]|uniref:hypothetical protein n=1 Tax=uncultured Ruminococcus sp. TaxID=165186 RepID=UPI0026047E98|nr:hypothetical protein [uncultured Ruminococcus sp.]
MGLFGGNYERAGAGIAKNAPKKKGFFRFMEIFVQKFWKLLELNVIYFLCFVPLLGAVALYLTMRSTLGLVLAVICLLAFVVLIGPATAAHTKILKNFFMEKPTFLLHDFLRTMRSEFKHSVVVGMLDCLLVCCISAAFYVYPQLIEQTGSKVYYVFFAITLSIGLIALLMNFYIFLMMISTNLSLKNVLKNSLALAVVALKKNVITLLIVGAVVAVFVLVFVFVDIKYSLILLFLLPFMPASWLGLVVVMQCYPVIQKYIINPYYEQRGEVNPELMQSVSSEEEAVFEDMGGKEKPIEPAKKAKSGKSGGKGSSRGHKGKIIS